MKAVLGGIVGILIGAAGGYFGATQFAPTGSSSDAVSIATDEEMLAYGTAYNTVVRMKNLTPNAGLSAYAKGVEDALEGRDMQISDIDYNDAAQRIMMAERERQEAIHQKQIADNKAAGEAFMKEKQTEDGVVITDSGLGYKVLTEGDGPKPGPTDRVTVHYKGMLIDGTVFDSSIESGEPASFLANRVISGWTEALQLMSVGSKYELYIPADLAYGDMATGIIPAGSLLIFEVELLGIED